MMATIFALSLVPAGAWATENTDANHGEMAYDANYDTATVADKGVITIEKTKANETYNVYRIFDLASFNDANPAAGHHADPTGANAATEGEAYSYVIRQYTTGTTLNPWWDFLMNHGVDGGSGKYAAYGDGTGAAVANQYFWIENDPITLTDANGNSHSDYHVVRATSNFTNAWDVANADASEVTAGHGTFDYDGTGTDYVSPSGKTMVQVVQDFAQAALAYADSNIATPNYVEVGKTGANGNTEGTSGQMTVNTNTQSSDKHGTENDGAGTVPLGWYLMGTTTGTLASLDTTNKNVTIYEKNQVPELEKRVLKKKGAVYDALADLAGEAGYNYLVNDTGSDDWVANTDADIADYVMFRSVITAQQGADNYRLHDSMEMGLQFVDEQTNATGSTANDRYVQGGGTGADYAAAKYTTRVFLVRGTGSAATVKEIMRQQDISATETPDTKDNWALTKASPGANLGDGCDFEIEFKDAKTDSDTDHEVNFYASDKSLIDVKDGDRIVVLYWAYVTASAVPFGSEDTSGKSGEALTNYITGLATGNAKTDVKDNRATGAESLVENDGNATAQQWKLTDGNNRNTNSTILTYGERSHTDWKRAEVTTYQLDVVKIQAGSTPYKLLNGAKFAMYKATADQTKAITAAADGLDPAITASGFTPVAGTGPYYQGSKAMSFTQDAAVSGNANVASYRYDGDVLTGSNTNVAKTVLTSDFDEEIRIYGVEEGWYLLVEKEAPEGFNKLAHPILVYVNGDENSNGVVDPADPGPQSHEGELNVYRESNTGGGTGAFDSYTPWNATVTAPTGTSAATNPATYSTSTTGQGGVQIINQTGQELPSTGGIGTTIFYVAGTVLVVGAAVALVAKRRMGSEA